MAQDSDVARVAAALKAPGLRYRSFGNEPVRSPRVDPESVAEAFPLLGAAMEDAAETMPLDAPHEPAAEEAVRIPAPPALVAPEPEPMPAPLLELPPAAPVSEPVAAVQPASEAPPLFLAALSQPLPAPPAPVPPPPPAQLGYAPPPPPAPVAPPAYSLLESLGRQSDLTPSMAAAGSVPAQGSYGQPAATASGTFASLLAHGPAAGGGWNGAPGTALRTGSLLPAAAVTVPLSEVLRLVAVGAPSPSSPFDAFRAAVRAPGSR